MYLYLCTWAAAIAAAIFFYCRRLYSTFSRAGVKSLPTVPLLGNMAGILFKTEDATAQLDRLSNDYPTERFVGRYEFLVPTLLIRDVELVRRITVKDFEHFHDHRTLIDVSVDPLFGRNLLTMKGQEWKHMRSALSPAFTSSKIKLMVPFMVEVGNQMMEYLKQNIEKSGGKLNHKSDTSNETDFGYAVVEESSEGKNTVHKEWTDNDLVAQALIFFIAGFSTVSTGISWLLHELAVNPDIQERLSQEIKENIARNGGKVDYKSIQEMKYLDMVLPESLRKWPPSLNLRRMCNKDYNCGKPNDKALQDFIVRKGQSVSIPVWMFHRNPRYYPEPLKFDPERFSDENKHNIDPFTYMPFGLGPRNCIGSRFALCEIKVLACMLLQQLDISPCEKTCIPEQLENGNSIRLRLKSGHWLRFKLRN